MAEFLNKIAKDELEHATELAERIIELGGLPTNIPTLLVRKLEWRISRGHERLKRLR